MKKLKLEELKQLCLSALDTQSREKTYSDSQAIEFIKSFLSNIRTSFDLNEKDCQLVLNECLKKIETRYEEIIINTINLPEHKDWLNDNGQYKDIDNKDIIDYKFWNRYKNYLNSKNNMDIDQFETQVRKVIQNLNNPRDYSEKWDIKGMVVGNIQMGKTTHYTGLINQAIDVGYKVIIVLGGIGNDLRKQTQERITHGVIGLDNERKENDRIVGVGNFNEEDIGYSLKSYTNTSLTDGDFNGLKAGTVTIPDFWAADEKPMIFVVKKNKIILDGLISWFKSLRQNNSNISSPMLLIDDECDYASIDTEKSDDPSDEEHNPTAINRSIRTIFKLFDRSAYVGYTATPYGNIFQLRDNADNIHDKFGLGLFPDNFITLIRSNKMYCGPNQFFPNIDLDYSFYRQISRTESEYLYDLSRKQRAKTHKSLGLSSSEKEDIKRALYDEAFNDEESFLNKQFIDDDNVALLNALRSFILSCAIKCLRGYPEDFNTMLIHVNREVIFQNFLFKSVKREFNKIKNQILSHDFKEIEDLFFNDFVPTTNDVIKSEQLNSSIKIGIAQLGDGEYSFSEVKKMIIEIIQKERIVIVVQNSKNKDTSLDYSENKRGQYYICIGGDILSRGLTLEGLTISYFLRDANTSDTLLQMGRWFGYRSGYLDLCRVFTSPNIRYNLSQITSAQNEMFEMFENMELLKKRPYDFGMRVANSQGKLEVTSLGKRRYTEKVKLNFSSLKVRTYAVDNSFEIRKRNFETLNELIESSEFEVSKNDAHIYDVNLYNMIEFIKKYNFVINERSKFNKIWLIDYLNTFIGKNKFQKFKIIIKNSARKSIDDLQGYKIGKNIIYPAERLGKDNSCTESIVNMPGTPTVPQDKDLWIEYDNMGIPTLLIRPCYGFNWIDFKKDFNDDFSVKKHLREIPNKEKVEKPETFWGFDKYPVLTHFFKFPDDSTSYDEEGSKEYTYDLKGFNDHLEYIQGELNFPESEF